MINDQNLIFEQYIKSIACISEAKYHAGLHGLKQLAGAHKRGYIMGHPEELMGRQGKFEDRLQKSIDNNEIVDLIELLTQEYTNDEGKTFPPFYEDPDDAKYAILTLTGANFRQRTNFNPFPDVEEIGAFRIPYFRIPDLILNVESRLKDATEGDQEILNALDKVLKKTYKEYQISKGQTPEDVTELSTVRSFRPLEIERTDKFGNKYKTITTSKYGGKERGGQAERFIRATTKDEYERLKHLEDQGFTVVFDPSQDPETLGQKTPHMNPSRELPPSIDFRKHRTEEPEKKKETKPKSKPKATSKPKQKKPEPKKPETKKPETKKPEPKSKSKKETKPEPKSKAKKQRVEESYFFKIIPF
jgi:hypothetical protein